MAESKSAIVARLEEGGRIAVGAFLTRHGYEVVTAEQGKDALAAVAKQRPDLLILDGILPKLSGFEVCRQAKMLVDPHALPVVLILEEGDQYGRGRARAEGVDLILTEPLLDDDLSELLRVSVDPKTHVDSVLGGSPGTHDRLIKELLRGGASRNDPITARISDPLTGLHHKAFISMKLEEEFKKAQRYGHPFSILLVDVENFDQVATELGKPVAQEMLLEVAGIFLCESRDVDCSGRVDTARFMLLLPDTDLEGARIMADRVFQQVCARTVSAGEREVAIRASVGIAALPNDQSGSVDEFVERALRAMRTASNLGGNRICAWGDSSMSGMS